MKKVLVTCFSIIIAFSFSAVVFAANHVNTCTFKITKQVILSEDEPAPAPEPAPEPTPAPEPE
jgi:hypothetical protein